MKGGSFLQGSSHLGKNPEAAILSISYVPSTVSGHGRGKLPSVGGCQADPGTGSLGGASRDPRLELERSKGHQLVCQCGDSKLEKGWWGSERHIWSSIQTGGKRCLLGLHTSFGTGHLKALLGWHKCNNL